MLESMTSSPRPTRAEVTDVANAIIDGSDAVMLSAETAIGKYPVRTIEVMAAICCEAESSPTYPAGRHVDYVGSGSSFASAIAQATADTANALDLATVVAFTESGSTAQLVSKYRPRARIVGFTPNEATYYRMAIMWGVTPAKFPRLDSTDEMIFKAEESLLAMGVVEDREPIAMAAGIPPNVQASTNLLKLHIVGDGAVGMPQ
jgi:pyruvate kinase